MPKKKKVPSKRLKYLGDRIRTARNDLHLTQQAIADQTGVGLRHYQNIEKGLINPSYEILFTIIQRLALSADVLFYPEISHQDEEMRDLSCKFAACTKEERQFLLSTVDHMVNQFISRRVEKTPREESK